MADTGEDLDYHITFPSPPCRDVCEEESADNSVTDQEEPVVVLLGWLGCQDKHLAKYSHIYDRSCITIRYTASSEDIFMKSENLKIVASKLLELIIDLNLQGSPLFFHVFSNGGCMVYRFISELLHGEKQYQCLQMTGAIFDSCPGQRSPVIGAKAFLSSSMHTNVLQRYALAFLLMLCLYLQIFFRYIVSVLGKKSSPSFFEGINKDPSSCPQLYIYSAADELISHIGVESHISSRQRLGVCVQKLKFDETAHVQHLRKHREPYIQNCLDFVAMCSGKE